MHLEDSIYDWLKFLKIITNEMISFIKSDLKLYSLLHISLFRETKGFLSFKTIS